MSSQYSPRARNARLDANPSGLPVLFYAGVGFYLFSFFLPAVQLAGTPLRGWTCLVFPRCLENSGGWLSSVG